MMLRPRWCVISSGFTRAGLREFACLPSALSGLGSLTRDILCSPNDCTEVTMCALSLDNA